jgi:ribosomal protein S27AE
VGTMMDAAKSELHFCPRCLTPVHRSSRVDRWVVCGQCGWEGMSEYCARKSLVIQSLRDIAPASDSVN